MKTINVNSFTPWELILEQATLYKLDSTMTVKPVGDVAWGHKNELYVNEETIDIVKFEQAITALYDPSFEVEGNLAGVREMRDKLIAETDFWVFPDRTPTQEQLDYRQALRDITDTYSSLEDVVWPVKPE